MKQRTFVGFGFGAIQGGLFLLEARRTGNFGRLVVAEVVPELVAAVRRAGGRYHVNVATAGGIEQLTVDQVEILSPLVARDRDALVEALAQATEIATALPGVAFYDSGPASIAELLAKSLELKARRLSAPPGVIYTAENHNRAAEILQQQCAARLGDSARAFARESVQFLNTVIGKMSGVVTDAGQIASQKLICLADHYPHALLVEEFNRILITQIRLPGFARGIAVFEEKPDLLPFAEAKLYGHNAVHALMGYLAHDRGHQFMSTVADDLPLAELARAAFLEEAGMPMIRRHAGVDPLFTPEGWCAHAEDLLVRMTNPHLRDRVERVIRDPRRKLGWDDRLAGTMRLALEAGVTPGRFALGAAAAARLLVPQKSIAAALNEIWAENGTPDLKAQLIGLVSEANVKLNRGIL